METRTVLLIIGERRKVFEFTTSDGISHLNLIKSAFQKLLNSDAEFKIKYGTATIIFQKFNSIFNEYVDIEDGDSIETGDKIYCRIETNICASVINCLEDQQIPKVSNLSETDYTVLVPNEDSIESEDIITFKF